MLGSFRNELSQNLLSFERVALFAAPSQRKPEISPRHQVERSNLYRTTEGLDCLIVLAAMEPHQSCVFQHLSILWRQLHGLRSSGVSLSTVLFGTIGQHQNHTLDQV